MSFQLYHLVGARMALVKERPVADDQQFREGALLVENVDGEYEEVEGAGGGEYPYEGPIDAIALARYGVDGLVPYEGTPSFDILGGLGFIPGNMQGIVVDQGNRERWFSAEYEGALPTVTGGTFGVVRGADMRWRVNFDDTASSVVRLESLAWTQDPINKNRVVVSFVEAGA
jgi:hypothetical protein